MADRIITIVVDEGRAGELWAQRLLPDGTLTPAMSVSYDYNTRELLGYGEDGG